MRWPFMLRSTHDALMALQQQRFDDEAAYGLQMTLRYDQLRERHDAFVATIAERATPPARPVTAPPVVRPRDAADVAVSTAAMFDPRRRRYLENFVRDRRAEGMAAEDIAQQVLHPPATDAGEWEMPE